MASRPHKLDPNVVNAWLAEHAAWTRGTDPDALVRSYSLPDFAAALALAVRIGMAAEKRDHHPDLVVGWGKLRVTWTTHDAGGITDLDLALAAASDAAAKGTAKEM
jgi:4a-hydroxytetrahydrobiopterin dehydratase